jgi:hypothetical protein
MLGPFYNDARYRTMCLGWFYGALVLSDTYFGLVDKTRELSDACGKFVY